MKQVYIIQEGHPKLLLFFAGWAADETPFKQYRPQGMDYMICYDYRNLDFDASVLHRYRYINIVSWSMGVWAAYITMFRWDQGQRQKILTCSAFNGTPSAINDDHGIPVDVYLNTLKNLTPASLQKFMRRMCKDSAAYKEFMKITPRRDFDEIKEELRAIEEQYIACNEEFWSNEWDEAQRDANLHVYVNPHAYIGKQDRIVPPGNQYAAHKHLCQITCVDCAHYDEPMFRFLLQDQWGLTFDGHQMYLKSIDVELDNKDDE